MYYMDNIAGSDVKLRWQGCKERDDVLKSIILCAGNLGGVPNDRSIGSTVGLLRDSQGGRKGPFEKILRCELVAIYSYTYQRRGMLTSQRRAPEPCIDLDTDVRR